MGIDDFKDWLFDILNDLDRGSTDKVFTERF